MANQQSGTTLGNPAVVGLAGFGLTTLILQFHNLGWDFLPIAEADGQSICRTPNAI